MKTVRDSIYNYPKYYDLVYGSDYRAELYFLEDCFERYCSHVVRRLFEPACGTGRLLRHFARAEYEVSGVDLCQPAVAYCNERLARIDDRSRVRVGDMTDFQVRRKFHAAFNTINSFRHLLTGRQAVSHLQCISEGLVKGGIYVLGVHLTPTVGVACSDENWSARRGHLVVNTSMWLKERNLAKRYEEFHIQFDVYTPTQQMRIQDEIKFRTYTRPQILDLAARVPTLEIAGVHDFGYDIDYPMELDDETEDVVLVFRKR